MQVLSVELENCYGIRKLNKDFDFAKTRALAVYAPNGSMKTSLAHVFEDIAKGASRKIESSPQESRRGASKTKQGRI